MRMKAKSFFMILWVGQLADFVSAAEKIAFLSYPNCIKLESSKARVILCPDAGGRVLEYSMKGVNALHLDPREAEWKPGPINRKVPMSAGRFDIGPELVVPERPELMFGQWTGRITGERSAALTSPPCPSMGIIVDREFELAADSTRLICRQVIRNISDRTVEYCHWARTFSPTGGYAYVPLTQPTRFPKSYVMYEGMGKISNRPVDPNVTIRDGFLIVTAAPAFPKLGFDSYAGWFAYQQKSGLLFVKRYPTYPDRVYNELAGLTISIWYPNDRPMVELEPIGPRLRIAPGKSDSFAEEWWLLENEFPPSVEAVDLKQITRRVETETRAPGR